MDWSTVLQVATILSLLTPLVLALMRALGGRKQKDLSEAQVVQGMTMTLAGGLQERINTLQVELVISERENDALEEAVHLLQEILRANGLRAPRTPQQNRNDREDQS